MPDLFDDVFTTMSDAALAESQQSIDELLDALEAARDGAHGVRSALARAPEALVQVSSADDPTDIGDLTFECQDAVKHADDALRALRDVERVARVWNRAADWRRSETQIRHSGRR